MQLAYAVDQHEVFPLDHPYATGNTRMLREHFEALAHKLLASTRPYDLVVDIGANDGTLLASYGDSVRPVAVEPTGQAHKCRAKGIETYQVFFTAQTAADIRKAHGPAKIITATNVLAHVPDPHDFVEGVKLLLDDEGIFVTENHDLAAVTDGLQIDTIYHEHLRYYSVASLSILLAMHGLTVADMEHVPTHGGSHRVYARKARRDLAARAIAARNDLRQLLGQVTADGGEIYGVGATTRATPLLHFASIGEFLTCVCEVATSEKIGQCMPGTSIPIVNEIRLLEDQPAYALLFAWHIAADLIPKLRSAGYRGKFIIPLPEPSIADA